MPIYSFPSSVSSKVMKSQVFTTNGTFTVLAGVTAVYITGCGGGGGGGGGYLTQDGINGSSGGVTSFGALKTLSGGGGGGKGLAGRGGARGEGYGFGSDGGYGKLEGSVGLGSGGQGGGGLYSLTAAPGGDYADGDATGGAKGAPGSGGSGSSGYLSKGGGGGGGAGDFCVDFPLTVVPGTVYTITIGIGGTGGFSGGGGNPAGSGGPGLLIVKWWE